VAALMDAWNIPEAKARLSKILRRARAGQPQTIGSRDPCVVVSSEQFEQMQPRRHLGQWLLANAPEIGGNDPGDKTRIAPRSL
jgi:prevent-host-death family protein